MPDESDLLRELEPAHALVRLEHVSDLVPRGGHQLFLLGLHHPRPESGGHPEDADRG